MFHVLMTQCSVAVFSMKSLILFWFLVVTVCAEVYFKEEFLNSDWEKLWVASTSKGSDAGAFKLSAGKFYNNAERDKGIQTSQDAKFYGLSAKFSKPFSNEGKHLVIQFQVKHEQSIDCGGGYIKVVSSDVDQKGFHGESPYKIMFGPDICGASLKKVHVIFNYKGKNLLIKKDISCKDDEFSHLYTLIMKPDNTYEVLIDNESAEKGSLELDWDFLEPKTIKDPNANKPSDWEDNEKIDDPADKKPEDWDKPKTIPDPKAKKPDDWDSEMDGEWEAAQIDNPEYKGEWKPKQIDNPKYKGPWIHPEIDNPKYEKDSLLYKYDDIGGVAFDLWQVKSGTIFDNIFIGDDPAEAKAYGEDTWRKTADGEKKMKENYEENERKKAEEKTAEMKPDNENVDTKSTIEEEIKPITDNVVDSQSDEIKKDEL